MTIRRIGASSAVISVFASVCEPASADIRPGGRCGPSTQMTSGTAIADSTIQIPRILTPS
jgi:methylphosphotriester-DNA--protein-cysteine methyltransferase